MADLVKQGRAPPSAMVPDPIKNDGLFKLDVDDSIWQDVGLGDDEDGDHEGESLCNGETLY